MVCRPVRFYGLQMSEEVLPAPSEDYPLSTLSNIR